MPFPSARGALGLFALVVLAWGLNWPVAKMMLIAGVPPLWMLAIRSAIATVTLLPIMILTGNLRVPKHGDWPVVFGIALLHMTGFAILMAIGIGHIAVGRSIVLGYTTPLWVVPGAILFLGERLTPMRIAGVSLGLAGLIVLFNPIGFNWADARAVKGNAFLLASALCWAASMLQIRAHRWVSTPFQLVFWETLVATIVLGATAFASGPLPAIAWDAKLVGLFTYGGVIGVALAYWAMAVVNRSLPAVTTSVGLLVTPVVGIFASMVALGEPFDPILLVALALIGGGIVLDIVGSRKRA
jgi:drug/metabolite transporter (DMT)-like permease